MDFTLLLIGSCSSFFGIMDEKMRFFETFSSIWRTELALFLIFWKLLKIMRAELNVILSLKKGLMIELS